MATLARLADVTVDQVQGLAGKRAAALQKVGIRSVADLLLHVPRRYIDRSRVTDIASLPLGEEVTIIGTVASAATRRPRRNLTITEARVTDGVSSIKVVWFNQAFRERQLKPGTEVALSGKVELFRGSRQMQSPAVDVLGGDAETLVTGRVVPIHPSVGDLAPGHLRRSIHNALQRSKPLVDPLPPEVIERNRLLDRETATSRIHFPDSLDQIEPARRRLVFDELFRLEVALALRKHRLIEEGKGISHEVGGGLATAFLAGLPYRLTEAQVKVLAEIRTDLASPHPMHRLLQGEVGSGKTVVAVATLLEGIAGGFQGAIMAPTEVLAAQHYYSISGLLELAGLAAGTTRLGMDSLFTEAADLPEIPKVRLAVLTSTQAAANFSEAASRQDIHDWVAGGDVDLVVGTHALIQDDVEFARLGVAVVDEQHRFGVAQRVQLKGKAGELDPDVLIMTATPIPRTLAMTLYGDLDVSLLDQMPPGRYPATTLLVSGGERERAHDLIREEVSGGRQAFIVCPLVEDSAKIEAVSATAEYDRLTAVFPGLRLGLLHGQLPGKEKESVMAAFRGGELDVLVATTVIEVGIDVPNATVMMIEDADRFGLSQLHQLRGRVGRGAHRGICVVVADPTTEEGKERLEALVTISDGFRLAEEDLRIRGQGTVFGTRQSGIADLRLADVIRDIDMVVAARREAFALVAADPRLEDHPEIREEVRAMLGDEVEWLFIS